MTEHTLPLPGFGPVHVSQVVPVGTHAATLGPIGHPPPASVTLTAVQSPFTLGDGDDADVAIFQDARLGFSHQLPGRPVLAVAQPGDPTADASVVLQDAPVTVRYKLEREPAWASSAAEVARRTAERFASWRAQAVQRIDFANPSWLSAWGVDAAALATYDVSSNASVDPRAHEDLFVLVRQGHVLLVTWSYPRELADDPIYASFASVAEATMVWDPSRWDHCGRIWPSSTIIGPGLRATPTPRYFEGSRWIGEVALGTAERARALGILAGIAGNIGAPWVALSSDVLARSRAALVSAFRSPELQMFIRSTFREVHTAHDLRGLAVLLGRAIENGSATRGRRTA
jgi:hypothetical protein